MKFLTAAWFEFLKNIRDIKMLAIVIVFPIITIYLIGSATEGFFEPIAPDGLKIAYVDGDRGAAAQAFGAVLGSDELKGRLVTVAYPTLGEGMRAVDAGTCTALIHLPAGLSGGIMKGETRSIEVYGGRGVEFVEAVANRFASAWNANAAIAGAGRTPVAVERKSVIRSAARPSAAIPNMTDYYAVLILLQILMAGTIYGSGITAGNPGSDIHIRIHALPVNRWELLYGRIAGSSLFLLAASAFIMLFTKIVYGVNWGANLPVLAGTLVLYCFTTVGLGAAVGRAVGKYSTTLMVALVLMLFLGMFSGSVSPRSGVTALGFLTPNYYAKLLIFGSIYGYSARVMAGAALVLSGIAVAVHGALSALMRRVRHDNI